MISKKLLIFFLLAYLISWSISVPLARSFLSNSETNLSIHYFSAFGPLISAFITVYLFDKKKGFLNLLKRLIITKLNLKFLLTISSPLIIFSISYLIIILMGKSLSIENIGDVNFLGNIGFFPSLLLWIFTFGLGEETGWRGFALVELQKYFSFKKSVLILSVVWFAWHIPFFIYNGNLSEGGLFGILMYGLSLFCGCVVLSYLFLLNDKRILPVAIWHAIFNWITASKGLPSEIPMIMSILVVIWAIWIWRKDKGNLGTVS